MTSKKLADKFIPKMTYHTTSRIKKIVKNIKNKEQKEKNKRKRTGIKTYKKKYQAQLLKKNDKNQIDTIANISWWLLENPVVPVILTCELPEITVVVCGRI